MVMRDKVSDSDDTDEEGILALDRELRIMSCNDALQRICDMQLQPGGFFHPSQIWPQEEADALTAALRSTLEGVHCPARLVLQAKKGKTIATIQPLFDGPDRIVGLIMTLQNTITRPNRHAAPDRKNHKNDIFEGIEHQVLLENLPEGVFTINTHWRIQSFNRRAEEITGYRRDEVVGSHCWEIFRSDLCQVGCPLRTALESGLASMDQDVRILKKGGKRQTILVNTGVLRTAAGKIRGAVETFRPLAGEAYFNGLEADAGFAKIIGRSKGMQRIFEMLPDIAASDANVLITGESGTGKDLIAHTIHELSSRRDKPFVAVNCSALAESLLESELFGHEKSAFTGATGTKLGRFELAKGGSLFLDEIGELKPELQIKLLRILESHEFERVGGTRALPMEARLISATHRDLRQAISEGVFREDFYYRLRTVPVAIPPLREREEDIVPLVNFFLKKFNKLYKKRVMSVHPEVMQMFMRYPWPGNVRELERTLEHAYVFVKGPIIMPANLPSAEEFQSEAPQRDLHTDDNSKPTREALEWALLRASGNRLEAARMLGISRTTLWRHLKRLNLTL